MVTLAAVGAGLRIVLTSVFSWPEVRRGGERYAHELASALRTAGHQVTILSTASRPSTGEVLGVPVRRLRARPLAPRRLGAQAVEAGFGLQALARLAGARVDVWHATGLDDAAAACLTGALRPRLATVFTDHGFPVAASRRKRADARLQPLVARRVGAYVCVSGPAGDWLRRDYGRQAAVVPPGVHVHAFTPADRREPRPTLLYSGTVDEPRKNVRLLLEAAARLRATVPDLQVWLLGPGDVAPILRDAPAPELVTRHGVVPDDELRAAYARAWATVLPSTAEAFGMAVTESLAAGTPAVVLRGSGGPETILTDVALGRLADGTADSLAHACGEALDLAATTGTAEACRAAARRYDWAGAVVPAMEEVYAGAR